MNISIKKLADCENAESVMRCIGEWFLEEWGEWPQHQSVSNTIEKFQKKLNTNKAPLALVAFCGEQPIGTASLNLREMTTRLEFPYWLGDLYVVPENRLQGVGTKLMESIVEHAKIVGAESVYLYTEDQEKLYLSRGWKTIETTVYDSHDVVVMKREV